MSLQQVLDRPTSAVDELLAADLAFQVGDSAGVADRLTAAGATLVAGPVVTPWQHRNVRLDPPQGVQLTLFEVQQPPG